MRIPRRRAGSVSAKAVERPQPQGINEMLEYDDERLLNDRLLDARVMAIDTSFYKGMRDRLYSDFKTGASAILYQMGLGYGELMGRNISKMGLKSLTVYNDFIKRGRLLGMGRFETPVIQMIISGLKGEPVVRLKQSFFAEAAGETGQPECQIFAGMIAGAAKIILKKDYECVEEKCVSKGDPYCVLRLRVRKGPAPRGRD